MKKPIKVAYLVISRSNPGLLKQIEYDHKLTKNINDISWRNFTFLDQVEENSSSRMLPYLFRGVFGRRLFAWIWLLGNSFKYDFVIVRHMEFDIFAIIFAWFVPNRILVHHSKEVIELKVLREDWRGSIASFVEKIAGGISVRTSCALLAVSKDLMKYQRVSRNLSKDFPIYFFPNGIIVENIKILNEIENDNSSIQIGFIAGRFLKWHGLDSLLQHCIKDIDKDFEKEIIFHLIGNLGTSYDKQIRLINKFNGKIKIKVHGTLKQHEYWKIFCKCNIGIGALAMHRIGLTDGCTLKVREMLAMGLPIFSGHKDTALPLDFPFYHSKGGDLQDIIKFTEKVSRFTRKDVRDSSTNFIDKKIIFDSLGKDLKILFKKIKSKK